MRKHAYPTYSNCWRTYSSPARALRELVSAAAAAFGKAASGKGESVMAQALRPSYAARSDAFLSICRRRALTHFPSCHRFPISLRLSICCICFISCICSCAATSNDVRTCLVSAHQLQVHRRIAQVLFEASLADANLFLFLLQLLYQIRLLSRCHLSFCHYLSEPARPRPFNDRSLLLSTPMQLA